MNMKIEDLFYYTGFLGGIIISFKLISPLGWNFLVTLIISVGVGIGTGYLAERAYNVLQGKKSDKIFNPFITVKTKKCDRCKSQNKAGAEYCIKCGNQLR